MNKLEKIAKVFASFPELNFHNLRQRALLHEECLLHFGWSVNGVTYYFNYENNLFDVDANDKVDVELIVKVNKAIQEVVNRSEMSKVEQIKFLLSLAIDNGYKGLDKYEIDGIREAYGTHLNNCEQWEEYRFYSLNDIVLEFEGEGVSFIDALLQCDKDVDFTHNFLSDFYCDDFHDTKHLNHAESIRVLYALKPSSERLDFILETFKNLL